MIKKVVISVVILLAIGIGGFQWLRGQNEVPSGPGSNQVFIAGQQLLQGQLGGDAAKLALLVVGAHPQENRWAIRGLLRAESDTEYTKPFFGEIETICESWHSLTCWQLKSLTIDGRRQLAANPHLRTRVARQDQEPDIRPKFATATGSSPDPSVKSGGVRVDQSRSSMSGAAGTASSGNRSSATGAASAKPDGKSVIWRTVNDRVNARSGPGTEYKIYLQMPSRVGLRLLRREGDWGYFEYTGQNGQIGKVWISMGLVKADAG